MANSADSASGAHRALSEYHLWASALAGAPDQDAADVHAANLAAALGDVLADLAAALGLLDQLDQGEAEARADLAAAEALGDLADARRAQLGTRPDGRPALELVEGGAS